MMTAGQSRRHLFIKPLAKFPILKLFNALRASQNAFAFWNISFAKTSRSNNVTIINEMNLIDHLLVLILNYVEEQETFGPSEVPLIEGYTSDQVQYHIRMCEEIGWLRSDKKMTGNGRSKCTHVGDLTWSGHQHARELKAAQFCPVHYDFAYS